MAAGEDDEERNNASSLALLTGLKAREGIRRAVGSLTVPDETIGEQDAGGPAVVATGKDDEDQACGAEGVSGSLEAIN